MPETIIHNTTEAPSSASAETSLLLAFTRLEGKVDVALTQHGADIKATAKEVDDHEDRIRALEARPTVSPRGLWATVSGAALLALAVIPFLDRIIN
ncbi:hypothetical protein [Arthrobacter sp. B2a2-09]|uniref:hypothetical protein n=1 Tax=Arthrobacter sp. B2a2-09 TaxID=2952822 RepID=UPI0022CDA058|nr:hypothetical protein [Arthrobacter sp. B2a2-09]MCZ9884633.1 hypothetical protein [Arthrobacter sp. B2a2-09]